MANGKGSWRTKSEVNIGSLIQSLGYFSQMQDRSDIYDQNRIRYLYSLVLLLC